MFPPSYARFTVSALVLPELMRTSLNHCFNLPNKSKSEKAPISIVEIVDKIYEVVPHEDLGSEFHDAEIVHRHFRSRPG